MGGPEKLRVEVGRSGREVYIAGTEIFIFIFIFYTYYISVSMLMIKIYVCRIYFMYRCWYVVTTWLEH